VYNVLSEDSSPHQQDKPASSILAYVVDVH